MRAIVCIRWQCSTCQELHLTELAAERCCGVVEAVDTRGATGGG